MLEICCDSYYGAVQAACKDAKRIELSSELHLGGLTPSLGTLELVKEHCAVKIAAVVRPRDGGFYYCGKDFKVMGMNTDLPVHHDVDGITFGCLNPDSAINQIQNERLISIIHEYGEEAVFRRAFNCTEDPYQSAGTLIGMEVGRILTSGLKTKATEGVALLKELQAMYGDRIEILAGGGINTGSTRKLMEDTGLTQVHSSCKDWVEDPTTIANDISYIFEPAPNEGAYDVVSGGLVRKLLIGIGGAEETVL